MNNNEIDPVLFIWAALALVLVVCAVAIVGLVREGRANARKHSMALHPAGKARVTPVHPGWLAEDRVIPAAPATERTRHLDIVGFDWTK